MEYQSALKKVGISLSANIVSLLATGIITLIVPKFFTEIQYGYWQLYLFFAIYVGFFHFGLQDGMYLRYGGMYYKDLNKEVMHSQMLFLLILEVVVSVIILLGVSFLGLNSDKTFILFAFIAMMLIYLPSAQLQYTLQMTGRINEYGINIILEKSIYFIFVISYMICGGRDYKFLLIADIISKFSAFIYLCFVCKDIIISKSVKIKECITEAYKNMSVGIKLMAANVANMLIMGISRFAIENHWGIIEFGKVSLVFSLSNFFLIFIAAFSIVLFPILKRIEYQHLSSVYIKIDQTLITILLGLLIFYQPIKFVFQLWLPQYDKSLNSFIFLLPMCMFESKSVLLLNTYLKSMRKELKLFLINATIVVACCIYTAVTVLVFNNLTLTIAGVLLMSFLKCVLSEIYLSRQLKVSISKAILTEVVAVTLFLISNILFDGWIALVICFAAYLVYIYLNKCFILDILKSLNLTK